MRALQQKYNAIALQAGQLIARDMVKTIDSAAVQELARLAGQSQVSADLTTWLLTCKQGLTRSAWANLTVACVTQSIALTMPQSWPRVALFASSLATSVLAVSANRQSRVVSPLLAAANTLEAAKTMESLMSLYNGPGRGYSAPLVSKSAVPVNVPITQNGPLAGKAMGQSDSRWRSLEFFNWEELRKADSYPHLAVLGGTGGGKTYTTERVVNYLCPYLDRVKVVTTKRRADQWVGWTVIGPVRDFNAIGAELSREMADLTDRLERIDDPNLEECWTVFDEVPAIAAGLKEQWPDTSSALIREAREAKKRCCFLIQGNQVQLIGLKGQSDLRENLTYIRLGKFALIHARELVAKGEDPALLEWVKAQEYPILVEDKPAYLPPEVKPQVVSQPTVLEDSEPIVDNNQPVSYINCVPPAANI